MAKDISHSFNTHTSSISLIEYVHMCLITVDSTNMSVVAIAPNNYNCEVTSQNFPFNMLAVEIHQSYPPRQFCTILYVCPCTTLYIASLATYIVQG